MKGTLKAPTALTLLSDPQIATTGGKLAKLQATAIEQIDLIKRLESESALRAVLVGLALHRIKASLKHGEWGKWQTAHLEAKRSQVGYYMRLAIVCLEQGGFTKPDLLQIAEGGTELAHAEGPARRAFKKIQDFVGDKSLNELLCEHGLKNPGSGSGSGGSASPGPAGSDAAADAATEWLINLRSTYLDVEKVKTFPAQHLRAIEQQTASFLAEFRRVLEAAQLR